MEEALNIDLLVDKLRKVGLVTEEPTCMYGDYVISKHAHLLTKKENDEFIDLLHKASPHVDWKCSPNIIHRWKFEFLQD